MKHFDLLLPFSLPPAELARDLLRELKAPALAMLVARARERRDQAYNDFARALPHEAWLAERFELAPGAGGGSPPLAAPAMRAFGLAPEDGTWFLLQPVHLHVARDHLVLTDQRQLPLAEAEARELFETARAVFEERGHSLLYGDARHWFLRADDWHSLSTATLDAASGRNIDIWQPKGAGERDWRRLQNELQMLWHIHPLNQRREESGLQAVNSVWLSGGAPATPVAPPTRYGQSTVLERFAAGQPASGDGAQAPAGGAARLEVQESLIVPALTGDWAAWLRGMEELERERFAPLSSALKAGKIGALSLILTNGTHCSEFLSTRRSLARFWRQPTLSRLLP